MKLIELTSLITLCITCFCGCFNKEETKPETITSPYAGLQVKVAVPKGIIPLEEWESVVVEWSTRTQAEVIFEEIDFADVSRNELVKSYKESQANILVFPLPLKGKLQLERIITSLSRNQRNSTESPDLYVEFQRQLAVIDGQESLIPLSTPLPLIYYRKDLFEKHGLTLPTTWKEMIEFLKTTDVDIKHKLILPWGAQARATMFSTLIVPHVMTSGSMSYFVNFTDGTSKLEHPGYKKAFQTVGELFKHLDKSVAGYSYEDCRKEFLAGNALMAITLEPYPQFWNKDTQGDQQDIPTRADNMEISFSPLCGTKDFYDEINQKWGKILTGYTNAPVQYDSHSLICGFNANSENEDKNKLMLKCSYNLAQELMNLGFMDAKGRTILTPSSESQLSTSLQFVQTDLTFREESDYLGAITKAIDLQVYFGLNMHGLESLEKLLDTAASKLPGTELTSDQIYDEFKAAFEAEIEKLGPANIRDIYRAQLGLKPAID